MIWLKQNKDIYRQSNIYQYNSFSQANRNVDIKALGEKEQ